MNEIEIRASIRGWLAAMGAGEVAGDGADLVDTGVVQSMQLLELVNFVADRWGLEVSPGDLYDGHFASVDAIVAFVLKGGTSHGSARTN